SWWLMHHAPAQECSEKTMLLFLNGRKPLCSFAVSGSSVFWPAAYLYLRPAVFYFIPPARILRKKTNKLPIGCANSREWSPWTLPIPNNGVSNGRSLKNGLVPVTGSTPINFEAKDFFSRHSERYRKCLHLIGAK